MIRIGIINEMCFLWSYIQVWLFRPKELAWLELESLESDSDNENHDDIFVRSSAENTAEQLHGGDNGRGTVPVSV